MDFFFLFRVQISVLFPIKLNVEWTGHGITFDVFTVIFIHVSQTYSCTEISLMLKASKREPQSLGCRASALQFAH